MRCFTLALALLISAPPLLLAQAGSPEQGVYQAVLTPLIHAETQRLVLGDSTLARSISVDEAAWLRRQSPAVSPELLDDFRRQNARSVSLPGPLALPVPVVRVTETELRALEPRSNPNQWWEAFYRRFPGSPGSIRLSRVGFSPDGSHALVYMHHGCGGRGGSGAFVILRKQDGEWRIEDRVVRIMI